MLVCAISTSQFSDPQNYSLGRPPHKVWILGGHPQTNEAPLGRLTHKSQNLCYYRQKVRNIMPKTKQLPRHSITKIERRGQLKHNSELWHPHTLLLHYRWSRIVKEHRLGRGIRRFGYNLSRICCPKLLLCLSSIRPSRAKSSSWSSICEGVPVGGVVSV